MLKYNAYILFGAPGCGKGTQGRALGTLPGFSHCACGDVFRSISPATKLGQTVAEYSSRGELVPDSITIELWKNHILNRVQTRCFEPSTDLLLLDGIPRNVAQCVLLRESVNVKALINLQCFNHTELIARLRRRAVRENRLDDAKEEVIRHRLEVFEINSRPLLEFFGPEFVLNIDAQKPPMVVLYEILRRLQSHDSTKSETYKLVTTV